jgi:uncharacterized phage-associated protein
MVFKVYTAKDVARFALASADPDDNDISNLKLQKLCYYAQGIVTAMRGERLFKERVVAWDHGPVVPEVYHTYKENGGRVIPVVTDFDASIFDKADKEALEDIFEFYGQYSAWRLRNMTHDEKPWTDAYKIAQGSEITIDAMKAFFQPQIEADYVKNLYG